MAAAGTTAPVTPAAQAPAPTAGFRLTNQRSSQQTMISSANVAQMKPTWNIPTSAPVSSAPLIGNGQVYLADWGGMVTAADAATGKILWQEQVEQPNTKWPWHGFTGSGALDNGVLIEASVEGMAFGLDPATGAVKWQMKFTDQPTSGDVGSLLAYNGLVYIGLQSVDEPLAAVMPGFQPMARGGVVALNTHLFVQGDTLFFGAGVPTMFGGQGASGLFAYTVSPSGMPHVASVGGGPLAYVGMAH